jgi:DNA (cytosine-5)-methyltransferase 1
MRKKCNIQAIDLFCGAGGLTHGLLQEGISVTAGIDIDEACRYPYVANNNAEFLHSDISRVKAKTVRAYFSSGNLRLLAGCAPCQPFSAYTNGKDTTTDHKWGLLYEFERLVRQVEPELVTMENVPQVTKHSVFLDFVESLKSNGYFVSYEVVYCPDYGIPQHRKRLVLLASKLGEIKLLPPTHTSANYRTVRDTIAALPRLEAGATYERDVLHRASRMTPLNLKRIRQSLPGGTWRDWDQKLVADCHKKDSGKSFPGVYGRMEWDKPSPTITTLAYGFGNGRFGHPEQDRALSLREAALLQTFPIKYKFVEPGEEVRMREAGRLIGNAVPVDLGKILGRTLRLHVAGIT